MGLILVLLIAFLLIGTLPVYAYSRPWGYRPSGIFGIALVGLLILLLVGMIPWGFTRPVYFYRSVEVVNPRPVEVVVPPPGQTPPAPAIHFKELHPLEGPNPQTEPAPAAPTKP